MSPKMNEQLLQLQTHQQGWYQKQQGIHRILCKPGAPPVEQEHGKKIIHEARVALDFVSHMHCSLLWAHGQCTPAANMDHRYPEDEV